jgi:hypothetical protein
MSAFGVNEKKLAQELKDKLDLVLSEQPLDERLASAICKVLERKQLRIAVIDKSLVIRAEDRSQP